MRVTREQAELQLQCLLLPPVVVEEAIRIWETTPLDLGQATAQAKRAYYEVPKPK